MLYFSNGGFNHNDLYAMPTYMRNFYHRELLGVKKLEKEEMEKQQKKNKGPSFRKPSVPRR